MFATCIFCHSALGANESLEHFPVGKRVAFDAAKGRLWVVCPKCERWNLSPLEERWEGIEDAERAYRGTPKRVATDNIGLARLNDGTELVRIGAPLRPEFAAWRYGDQFGKRRRRQLLIGAGGIAAATGLFVAGPIMGLAIGGGSALWNLFSFSNLVYQKIIPRVRVTDGTGRLLSLAAFDLRGTRIRLSGSNDSIHLEFPFREWSPTGPLLTKIGLRSRPDAATDARAVLEGDDAVRAMAKILPALNGSGGDKNHVEQAVAALEDAHGSLPGLVRQAVAASPDFPNFSFPKPAGSVLAIPRALRLALEMSLHEDDERRALEGELYVLEQRWNDAEQIAAIADALTLPESISDQLTDLRNRKRG